jgi:hypothetical protein
MNSLITGVAKTSPETRTQRAINDSNQRNDIVKYAQNLAAV